MDVPDLTFGFYSLNIEENEKKQIMKLDFFDTIDVYGFYEIGNCIKEVGFPKTIQVLQKMKKFNACSLPHLSSFAVQAYSNIVSDLVPRISFKSIVKCPFCGSNNVSTKSVQTRGMDEPATDFNNCGDCGKKWSKN